MNFNLLSTSKRKEIYSASLSLLEDQGIGLESEEIRARLSQKGASVDADRVFFPENLVRRALFSAPKETAFWGQAKKTGYRLGAGHSYFGLGLTGINSSNSEDNPGVSERNIGPLEVVKLTNELNNVEFPQINLQDFSGKDVHLNYSLLERLLKTSNKPAILRPGLRPNIENLFSTLFEVIQYAKKEKRKLPNLSYSLTSTRPLFKSQLWTKQLTECIDNEIPVILEPSTRLKDKNAEKISHKITLAITDLLSSITISQLLQEGAPLIFGVEYPGLKEESIKRNLSSLSISVTITSALVEVGRFVGLPVIASNPIGVLNDFEKESCLESTLGFLVHSLSGADLTISKIRPINTGGYVPGSPVIINEIIGMVRRVLKGFSTNSADLALDLINEIGPKGDYITEKHTLENFKTEHWQPSIMDRQSFESWSSNGSKGLTERANERARTILAETR